MNREQHGGKKSREWSNMMPIVIPHEGGVYTTNLRDNEVSNLFMHTKDVMPAHFNASFSRYIPYVLACEFIRVDPFNLKGVLVGKEPKCVRGYKNNIPSGHTFYYKVTLSL